MKNSLLAIGLSAMLILATLLIFNSNANAQQDHEHADHAAETTGPSVNDANLDVEKVVEGLTLPTAMAFVDEDRILVLEKDNGTVRLVENGELQEEPALDVAVANNNERGMLGIAVSKENETTTYVFLYFTESGGGVDGDDLQGVTPAGNRLYRYELQDDRLVNPKLLLDLPSLPGPRYNGGPVVMGPDNNVYVIIGDVEGHTTKVQNFANEGAADGTSGVLRIGKNGETPEPVVGTGTFGKYYFAYGIRNSFGMSFDPVTGKLWDTENGPAFGDEINLVEAGFNSGWRDVQGMASDDNLTGLVLFNDRSHYSNPEFSWTEPVGPTALAFLNSSQLGEKYENDMFVGDINNGAIYHFEPNENRSALVLEGALADTVADTPEESESAVFGTDFGGVTDIKSGPDGYLYVVSFIDGTIFRIVPTEEQASTFDLTVRSAHLSGDTITGMFTVIKSSDGIVLREGYTPLTFRGEEGTSYVIEVSDFDNRKFDHWENDSTNRERTVKLDDDIEITAHYEILKQAQSSNSPIIDRFARLLNDDNCLDGDGERKLNNAIAKLIKKIFDEKEENSDKLEKLIDRIVEDCHSRQENNRGTGHEGRDDEGDNDGDD